MKTRRLFYEDVYIQEFEAIVLSCEEKDGKYHVILNATAFYPAGGGHARVPAEPDDRRCAPAHPALPGQGHLCPHPRCFGAAGAFVPQGVTPLRLYPV